MMPQFLQSSFDMLRESQAAVVENISAINPIAKMPGFEALKAQQEAFLKAMTGGMTGGWSTTPEADDGDGDKEEAGDLDAIRQQLAELQDKLSKLR
jgi:polyhydroxyalkanoate synthesis regulator protein